MSPPPASPHAPEMSRRLRRLLGPLHYSHVFWYRFTHWGTRVVPRWAVGAFVTLFTAAFFPALGGVRRAVGWNLEPVLGTAGRGPLGWARRQGRAVRTFWNVAWCHAERYEQHTGRRVEVTPEGDEHWRRIVEAERGFVLVTAHVGHWEVGSILAGSVRRRRVHVVREEEVDAEAQAFFEGLFAGREEGWLTVHFARGNPRLGIELLSALRRGEVVAIQGDRPSAWGRSRTARLFGRPVAFPVGPVKLARAAGVPLLPVFILREGRLRGRLVFRPPIEVEATGDADAAVDAALARLAAEVEAAIRRRPHQWFCFRRLWPAEGETSR